MRKYPAKSIAMVLPEGAVTCGTCRRKLGLVQGVPNGATVGETQATAHTGAWLGLLRRHLTRVRARVAEGTLRELAERLSAVGGTGDAEAVAVYEQVRMLLLTPRVHTTRGRTVMKITRLKETLEALPPDAEALSHVASTMALWRRVTGREMTRSERFRPDTVVRAMLAVPTPEPYIKHLHDKGLSALALMFHPNTLEARRGDAALRGVFGGGGEYFEDTLDQLDAQIVME